MKCPICKKAVALGDPDFPFCSERCRLIDLGNWGLKVLAVLSPASPDPFDDDE